MRSMMLIPEGYVTTTDAARGQRAYRMPGMRIRWWEIVVATLLTLVALLWLLGGLYVPGLVLLFLLAYLIASRAQVVERNVAGAHSRTHAVLALIRAVALFAILIVAVVLVWISGRRDWDDETPGRVAVFALAGLSLYLMRDISTLRRRGARLLHRWPRRAASNTGARAAARAGLDNRPQRAARGPRQPRPLRHRTDRRVRDRDEKREIPGCGTRRRDQQRDLGAREIRQALRYRRAVRVHGAAGAAANGAAWQVGVLGPRASASPRVASRP